MNDEFGYLAEEISKQSVKGKAWFLLHTYSKMLEEREKLKEELLVKRN